MIIVIVIYVGLIHSHLSDMPIPAYFKIITIISIMIIRERKLSVRMHRFMAIIRYMGKTVRIMLKTS